MNPLDLISAFLLYDLLHNHVPKEFLEMTFIDLITKMVDNMIATGHEEDYVKAIALMIGSDMETVAEAYQNNSRGLLQVFVEGLQVNRFPDLLLFCETVINGR